MARRPRISIAALIYRSPKFADSVWRSIHEFTPQLSDPSSNARFFFVANDPTKELHAHLVLNRYPWVMHHAPRPPLTEEELFEQGYAAPEYISRVYRAWNFAVIHGDEICVLVNSDHLFSPGWFDALIEPLLADDKLLVCSQSVEIPGFGGAWPVDFGRTLSTFRKQEFLKFVEENRQPGVVRDGGVFMPVAFWRKYAIGAGLYPEGNLHGGTYQKVAKFGDAAFFERASDRYGMHHVTAMDSVVYHLRCGEMDGAE